MCEMYETESEYHGLQDYSTHQFHPEIKYQCNAYNEAESYKHCYLPILLDARFQNPPLGGFKHVECLCGTPGIVSLLKTWFFQLCMIASTLFGQTAWIHSMD